MTEGKARPANPGPAHAGNRPAVAAFLAATAFLLVAGGAYLAVTRSGVLAGDARWSAAASPPPSRQPEPTPRGVVTPRVTPLTRPTTPAAIAVLPASTAVQILTEQADADETRVRSLRGYWVPQVSSKCAGVQVDIQPDWRPDGTIETPSVTMAQIAAFHAALRENYGALTTRPTTLGIDQDVATRGPCQGLPLWMSIVPAGFNDAAAANSWCDAEGIPAIECQARLVAPDGASMTVPRAQG